MKPRLLDLFCGAGGAAMGYARAGFDVTGVDIAPQPRYPFNLVQGDAFDFLANMDPDGFDVIHASPPCQHYSQATRIENRANHPDLLALVRGSLIANGRPWVIENVPGAPMRADLKLCGCMFGLGLERQRWFETSWRAFDLRQPCYRSEPVVNMLRSAHGPWYRLHGRVPTRDDLAAAAGIDWMHGEEIKQAIPPAYTEYIGRQLLDHLAAVTG